MSPSLKPAFVALLLLIGIGAWITLGGAESGGEAPLLALVVALAAGAALHWHRKTGPAIDRLLDRLQHPAPPPSPRLARRCSTWSSPISSTAWRDYSQS